MLLIILGVLSWSLVMVRSGLCWDAACASGLGFWGANGHDGIWHISLIKSLARNSAEMPVFAGEKLANYHPGFDLLLAIIHKISRIPVEILYFQLTPPILAILIGLATYKFVLVWRKSRLDSARQARTQALWALFFTYFAASFGWLVSLVREGRLTGESMFWAQQAISTLINPPFALSLLLLLLGLIALLELKKRFSLFHFLFAVFIFAILIEVKAYAGVLALLGLGLAILCKKNRRLIFVFFASLVISLLLFLALNKKSVGLLVFRPFWFLETMMGLSDRLGWPRFQEAMVNYRLAKIYWKAVPAYLIAFLIFWLGNMGTRVLGAIVFCQWLKKFKKIGEIEIFLGTVILAGLFIPLFFLQKGTPWNTIQFFYYSLFFSAILAGLVVGEWFERQKTSWARILIVIGVVLLTIPTTFVTLKNHYLTGRPPAKISNQELEALGFLSQQPEAVVLTYPFDKEAAEKAVSHPPRPLYLYESTAYVSAFSDKPVYLEDEVNLNITGYDWPSRREKVLDFLNTLEQNQVRKFLIENNISYIYWLKDQRAKLGETQLGITKIFENSEVNIYEVKY